MPARGTWYYETAVARGPNDERRGGRSTSALNLRARLALEVVFEIAAAAALAVAVPALLALLLAEVVLERKADLLRAPPPLELLVERRPVDREVEPGETERVAEPKRKAGPVAEQFFAHGEVDEGERSAAALRRLDRRAVADVGLQVEPAPPEPLAEGVARVEPPAPPERVVFEVAGRCRPVADEAEALDAEVAAAEYRKAPVLTEP